MWCNYHSCTISSTKWVGNGTGFLAGTKNAPLDFGKLGKKAFSFDDNPEDLSPPRPFGIYLPAASELSLNLLWFEIADITPEALKIIRRSKSIKAIGFEQQLSEPQVRILQSFPDTIKIKSSFPLNAYD